jgi:hypothetical protein
MTAGPVGGLDEIAHAAAHEEKPQLTHQNPQLMRERGPLRVA